MRIEHRSVALVNFKKGRGDKKPDVIVVHISEGSMSSLESWFANPNAKVSSHFGVSREGDVVRFVADNDQAYHAGKVTRPTAAIVLERPGISPNTYSLGIECAGLSTEDPTPAQMEVLAALVHQLAVEHNIPLTRRHIIGHREIRADKTCPGRINVDEVVRMALALTKAPPEPSVADVDVVAALNNLEAHARATLAEVERLKRRLA